MTRGVGIDVVDVPRFAELLTRRPQVAQRLFTPTEIEQSKGQSQRLAARFAAKEAFLKSLGRGVGAARWRDIEVVRSAGGAPTFQLHDTAQQLAREVGVATFHVSLTHSDLTAAAMVVGE